MRIHSPFTIHHLAFFLFLLLTPSIVMAEEQLTRRDGFLLIWQSIRRPAIQTQYADFEDLDEEDEGHTEITWAKRRKILEDRTHFYPDEPLTLHDALLWLYRTRNIDEIQYMSIRDLPKMMERYPLVLQDADLSEPFGSRERLISLIQDLQKQLHDEEHFASYYADDFHGQGTAFGETFDMNAITAAHRSFPHNTLVRVTNVENGKTVVVRINDRGPYVQHHNVANRSIDLSRAAFAEIAPISRGVIKVKLARLGDKKLVDSCTEQPRRYARRITRDVHFHRGLPTTWNVGEQLTLSSPKWFVVRSVEYPDGFVQNRQIWIDHEEKYHFTPSTPGTYRFRIGTAFGRSRLFKMKVVDCGV